MIALKSFLMHLFSFVYFLRETVFFNMVFQNNGARCYFFVVPDTSFWDFHWKNSRKRDFDILASAHICCNCLPFTF